MQEVLRRIGNKWISCTLLIITSLLTTPMAQSGTMGPPPAPTWHAIVSLGGGVAISAHNNRSQVFPIGNPISDEFYDYRTVRHTRTPGLFDSFIGVEWVVHPEWLVQLGVGYDRTGYFHRRGSFLQGADALSVNQFSFRYTVRTQQVLAESKLLYRFRERFYPYLILGLGAAFNDARHYRTNVPPLLTFTRRYQDHKGSSFAYKAGVGVDVDLFEYFRLGVGYRFADLGKVELGRATINTTRVGGTLSQTHFFANEVLAQVTFVI